MSEPYMVTGKVYESAVKGRQDFRTAFRRERERAARLEALLREARDRIPDWTTGVNADLLARIDAALADRTGG